MIAKQASRAITRLVVVGNQGGTNIGSSIARAASELSIDVHHCDARLAFQAPRWLTSINWKLRGHRPTRLSSFSQHVVELCRQVQPTDLISTGIAPLEKSAIVTISHMGVRLINYLTDDPWNSNFSSQWFFSALPHYDVFSPRRANLSQLIKVGCKQVEYLPFGFDPYLFYPEVQSQAEQNKYDVIFVGGCDRDRIPYITALVQAGFKLAIYGDYWDRFPPLKPYHKGHADPATLRRATSSAKVALCLVRRDNRDGHVVEYFEIPAVKVCMLAEATEEHRAIFGEDMNTIAYFSSIHEMVEKMRVLLSDEKLRFRLACAAHRLILEKQHTYKDRLETMLQVEEKCL